MAPDLITIANINDNPRWGLNIGLRCGCKIIKLIVCLVETGGEGGGGDFKKPLFVLKWRKMSGVSKLS